MGDFATGDHVDEAVFGEGTEGAASKFDVPVGADGLAVVLVGGGDGGARGEECGFGVFGELVAEGLEDWAGLGVLAGGHPAPSGEVAKLVLGADLLIEDEALKLAGVVDVDVKAAEGLEFKCHKQGPLLRVRPPRSGGLGRLPLRGAVRAQAVSAVKNLNRQRICVVMVRGG